MLVKRAMNWDESEMRWKGKREAVDEDEDEGDDPRTDSDTLDRLLEVSLSLRAVCADQAPDTDKWTRLAMREELPDPRPDEEMVLSPGYDPKKAEEEEKKNQADTANFSGGGQYLRAVSLESPSLTFQPAVQRMGKVSLPTRRVASCCDILTDKLTGSYWLARSFASPRSWVRFRTCSWRAYFSRVAGLIVLSASHS